MSKLREVMLRHGVQEHLIAAVVADMARTKHTKRDPDVEWGALLAKARAARLSVVSNRPKRLHTPANHLYEEYAVLVQEAIDKIQEASTLLLDDGQPVKPRDIEARRTKANAKRTEEGRPLLAECKHDVWYTWIAPERRHALAEKVRKYYADQPGKVKGKRFTPFVFSSDKQAVANAFAVLFDDIKAHRAMFKTPDSANDNSAYGATPHAALQVRACEQANSALHKYLRGVKDGTIDPITDPLPKDWRQLCQAELRTRLRQADDNPTLDLLTDFERRNFLDERRLAS